MSQFTDPLEVEYDDGHIWTLVTPFDYVLSDDMTGPVIHVPAGFQTDFATIPRPLWSLLPPTGKYGKAAVIHDYLYTTGGHVPVDKATYTKAQADEIFKNAMKVLGVPSPLRQTMWLAVHLFGKGNFDGL